MKLIIRHVIQHAELYDTPLFLGEWGNLDNSDKIFDSDPFEPTRVMLKALEDFGASTAYWHFNQAKRLPDYFNEFLQRPYPAALPGSLDRRESGFA